jgi:murein DD-endopeptidase MepM/ murein hydrolase activator NlpD
MRENRANWPRVISGFGSLYGGEGDLRIDGPHNGIDVAGNVDDPILAVDDGIVDAVDESLGHCGRHVHIAHGTRFHSSYCHLSRSVVSRGARVRRGEVIGYIGTSGLKPGVGYEHVHLSLWDVAAKKYIDPMQFIKGCFEPTASYPWWQTVLVFPVRC